LTACRFRVAITDNEFSTEKEGGDTRHLHVVLCRQGFQARQGGRVFLHVIDANAQFWPLPLQAVHERDGGFAVGTPWTCEYLEVNG
jgi:hypothetical protein